jgi:hypothetical protein
MTGVVAVMSGYGIHRVAAFVPPSGTGSSTTYTDGGHTYGVYTYTANGTFTVSQTGSYDVLVIGAGGGGSAGYWFSYNGSSSYGEPGYAGEYVAQTQTITPGTYTVNVGIGGIGIVWYDAAPPSGYYNYHNSTAGTSSSFNGITANGGNTGDQTSRGQYYLSAIAGTSTYYAQDPTNWNQTYSWSPRTPNGGYGNGGQGGYSNTHNFAPNTKGTNGQNGGNGVVFIRYQIS